MEKMHFNQYISTYLSLTFATPLFTPKINRIYFLELKLSVGKTTYCTLKISFVIDSTFWKGEKYLTPISSIYNSFHPPIYTPYLPLFIQII